MVEAHAWNEELDLAHEAMDHEHHLQIALVSALAEAIEQRRPWAARRLADQLVGYSAVHFSSEELLMDDAGLEGRDAHAAEHAALLARATELAASLGEEDGALVLAAALDLRAALAGHMRGADRRLAERVRR